MTSRHTAPRWIGLTAVTVLFGVESLRALIPLTVFVLRDRFGWHAGAVALPMMALLATGFLAAPCARALGRRRLLWLLVGGLGLARLALQAWTGDPLVDLGVSAFAAILFILALPALASVGPSTFVSGWLVGLAVDTALHGAYTTWDMSWRSDLASLLTVLALVALQWWLIRSIVAANRLALDGDARLHLPAGWVWTALGPLLFLEFLIFGNVARLATLTGWQIEGAVLWVLIGRILALAAMTGLSTLGQRPGRRVVLGLALMLGGSFLIIWPQGILAAVFLLVGQVMVAILWSVIVTAASDGQGAKALLSWNHGGALLAFGILLFLYYGSIDIALPFAKDSMLPVAALAIGGAALAASRPAAPEEQSRGGGLPKYAWLALTVLLAPALMKLAVNREVAQDQAGEPGFPLRIMTYNVHMGLDPRGHLGLEDIAATIEAENPDIVALQEVVRGWVICGNVDILTWLSQRLSMPYVFAGTADPLWGNAVLSRRPIVDFEAIDLPSEGLLIRRGLLAARIDLGEDEPFRVFVTHHHHKRREGAARERQSRAILDYWQGARRTAILGDFNGRPGEPEIEMLRAESLRDVLDIAGVEPGFTSPTVQPMQRIDYIWASPDLTANDVAVSQSQASDHLPVVATLRPGADQ